MLYHIPKTPMLNIAAINIFQNDREVVSMLSSALRQSFTSNHLAQLFQLLLLQP